jgi:hypothetical protein
VEEEAVEKVRQGQRDGGLRVLASSVRQTCRGRATDQDHIAPVCRGSTRTNVCMTPTCRRAASPMPPRRKPTQRATMLAEQSASPLSRNAWVMLRWASSIT